MKNKPKTGDIVKLVEPQWPTITGQGQSKGLRITEDGGKYLLPWGALFEIGDITPITEDSGSYPLLQQRFAESIQQQLKLIKG